MSKLDRFIEMLCGEYNNSNQILKESEQGRIIHPKAKHINGICNSKILNLPEDFNGYFIIEESYYEAGSFKNILPHLFLFTLNEDNDVVLISYEVPKEIKKEDFRNDNSTLTLDYNNLEVSSKFTPMVYKQNGDIFEGESISNFTTTTEFTLKEKIEENRMYVSEVFKNNGKITFGFENPIIYEKVNKNVEI